MGIKSNQSYWLLLILVFGENFCAFMIKLWKIPMNIYLSTEVVNMELKKKKMINLQNIPITDIFYERFTFKSQSPA